LLPPDGTPVTNAELRKQLNASDDDYWRVRNELLNQGLVTKLPGRGGKTALVVDKESKTETKAAQGLTRLIGGVFLLSFVGLAGAAIYGFVSIGSESFSWWNILALISGAITVSAVGVSLLIFKVQAESAQLEADGQARVLQRLESVGLQALESSSDARDLLLVMQPAVDATSDSDGSASPVDSTAEGDSVPDEDPTETATGTTILREHGTYYLPPAVPLNVLSDLVQWWDHEGETGRWTLSKLMGGYRRFNASGNVIGVPWILTFDGGAAGARSFRLAYSGRRKGPAVSELTEGGVWHDLVQSNQR
jgi:hypothetical protein